MKAALAFLSLICFGFLVDTWYLHIFMCIFMWYKVIFSLIYTLNMDQSGIINIAITLNCSSPSGEHTDPSTLSYAFFLILFTFMHYGREKLNTFVKRYIVLIGSPIYHILYPHFLLFSILHAISIGSSSLDSNYEYDSEMFPILYLPGLFNLILSLLYSFYNKWQNFLLSMAEYYSYMLCFHKELCWMYIIAIVTTAAINIETKEWSCLSDILVSFPFDVYFTVCSSQLAIAEHNN